MARLLRSASSLRRYMFPQLEESRGVLHETSMQLREFATKGKKKTKSDTSDSGEENMSKKELALKMALDQITKSFGDGSIMWLGRDDSQRHHPVISTGSFSLDVALGIGGLPKGRVVEIYGPEASGKTTLALHLIAEAQKQGGYCAFVDAEHALDPSLAEAIGVNTQNLLISQPDCGEQALSLVDTLIRSGSIDVVVVDSVAALVPKGELDGEMGDAHMAMQARLMSQALRKICHSLSLSQTILLFTNQVRAKLSTFGFGGPTEVTCGGNALKFYASVRLNVRRTAMVKQGEETTGSQVAIKIVKNKHAPPFRTAEFELEFGKGINRESELINLGCKHMFIVKSGSFLKMNDQNFHGQDALKRHLSENISVREELEKKLRDKLMHMKPDHEEM
ncbi:DNA repair protein recA homolog 3, mitochondrial isoform X2 [Salvia miltiorrhiza]|uniref:DNA repair protein recA homolog 3, mitochondrial isoform X2 n=1 Tax=Salvia miltiorrhiza TaxID=226208 RepID=UPI0025AC08BD|nr:DNA repair protein recA homolog 3, mitochondrial isoform X2 [Salvia miltiorrhiza]